VAWPEEPKECSERYGKFTAPYMLRYFGDVFGLTSSPPEASCNQVETVANWPRFGYDTHSRRSRDVCETVCETQGKAVCIINMRLALWFPR
jgi:hypothetical protein